MSEDTETTNPIVKWILAAVATVAAVVYLPVDRLVRAAREFTGMMADYFHLKRLETQEAVLAAARWTAAHGRRALLWTLFAALFCAGITLFGLSAGSRFGVACGTLLWAAYLAAWLIGLNAAAAIFAAAAETGEGILGWLARRLGGNASAPDGASRRLEHIRSRLTLIGLWALIAAFAAGGWLIWFPSVKGLGAVPVALVFIGLIAVTSIMLGEDFKPTIQLFRRLGWIGLVAVATVTILAFKSPQAIQQLTRFGSKVNELVLDPVWAVGLLAAALLAVSFAFAGMGAGSVSRRLVKMSALGGAVFLLLVLVTGKADWRHVRDQLGHPTSAAAPTPTAPTTSAGASGGTRHDETRKVTQAPPNESGASKEPAAAPPPKPPESLEETEGMDAAEILGRISRNLEQIR